MSLLGFVCTILITSTLSVDPDPRAPQVIPQQDNSHVYKFAFTTLDPESPKLKTHHWTLQNNYEIKIHRTTKFSKKSEKWGFYVAYGSPTLWKNGESVSDEWTTDVIVLKFNKKLTEEWESTKSGQLTPSITVSRPKSFKLREGATYSRSGNKIMETVGTSTTQVWTVEPGDKVKTQSAGTWKRKPKTKLRRIEAVTISQCRSYSWPCVELQGIQTVKVPLKKDLPPASAHEAYDNMMELERETVRVENELYYDEDLLDDYRKDVVLKRAIARSKADERALRAKMKRERRDARVYAYEE
eukprot:536037_1